MLLFLKVEQLFAKRSNSWLSQTLNVQQLLFHLATKALTQPVH